MLATRLLWVVPLLQQSFVLMFLFLLSWLHCPDVRNVYVCLVRSALTHADSGQAADPDRYRYHSVLVHDTVCLTESHSL
jgi:hypothetical protein